MEDPFQIIRVNYKPMEIMHYYADEYDAQQAQAELDLEEAYMTLTTQFLIDEGVISLESLFLNQYGDAILNDLASLIPDEAHFNVIKTKELSGITVEEAVIMHYCDEDDVLELYRKDKE